MTGDLVGQQRSIAYVSSTGQYRDLGSGQFVRRSDVLKLVDQETQRTKIRLQANTRLLISGKIDLPEWETRMAQSLKDSSLRIAALGSGGKDGMSQRHYGTIGRQLRDQYEHLDGFARALAGGKLTPNQALYRAGLYADSVKVAFHKAEKLTKESESFQSAKRSLDPQAKHCASCLSYSTGGEWQPIDQVTPPGVDCECGQFCRCTIVYSKFAAEVLGRAG